MNHDENPDDSILAQELRDSLSELAVPERPPLAAITSRGRACQRRRWLAGFVGLGGATAAAGIALALGLTSVFGAPPVPGTGTVQGAAFTLTSYANGTVSLRLGQLFDPAVLQRVLERRGIRALVKTDTYCSSSPIRIGVLPGPVSAGARHRAAPGPVVARASGKA